MWLAAALVMVGVSVVIATGRLHDTIDRRVMRVRRRSLRRLGR